MVYISDANGTKELPALPALEALEAVGKWGSFSEAARRLGTTQPAISQHIARLEAAAGCRLCERDRRGAELTEAGRQLFAAISQGLQAIRDGLREVKPNEHSQTVSIATDFALAALWLMPRLDKLKRRFPKIDLKVITGQLSGETPDLHADIAILFSRPERGRKLLFQERVFPVCAPSLMKQFDTGDPDWCLSAPLIYLDDEGGSGRWCSWEDWFAAAGVQQRPRQQRLRVNNHTLAIQAAVAGQGVALGWSQLVQPMIGSGHLARAHATDYQSRRGYFMWKIGRGTELSRNVLAWLKQEAPGER